MVHSHLALAFVAILAMTGLASAANQGGTAGGAASGGMSASTRGGATTGSPSARTTSQSQLPATGNAAQPSNSVFEPVLGAPGTTGPLVGSSNAISGSGPGSPGATGTLVAPGSSLPSPMTLGPVGTSVPPMSGTTVPALGGAGVAPAQPFIVRSDGTRALLGARQGASSAGQAVVAPTTTPQIVMVPGTVLDGGLQQPITIATPSGLVPPGLRSGSVLRGTLEQPQVITLNPASSGTGVQAFVLEQTPGATTSPGAQIVEVPAQ